VEPLAARGLRLTSGDLDESLPNPLPLSSAATTVLSRMTAWLQPSHATLMNPTSFSPRRLQIQPRLCRSTLRGPIELDRLMLESLGVEQFDLPAREVSAPAVLILIGHAMTL